MRRPEPKKSTGWLCGLLCALFVVAVGIRLGSMVLWRAVGADDPQDVNRVIVEPTAFVLQGQGPSLEGGVAWLNTAGPIRLEELRGKIVLLDFWTFCCINCHHILPDLAKLEEKYKNELVVIGVHSPKFFAERDTENIRRKVREYGIKHPVINDADQVIWNRFGVNSWPTLVLIDAKGEYMGSLSGEGHYAVLDKAIGSLVAKQKKDLKETPIKFFPENEKPDNTPLLFPGKVLADVEGKRLFVADTAHNRIVVSDTQGRNPKTIGTGAPGLVDGPYDKAGFNRPQGMCVVGETLYVADTENHAIRAVDLKARSVSTIAGNGQQSRRHPGSGPALTTSLSSPWDLVLVPKTRSLLIAMAGPHQIWRLDLDANTVGVWAGSGNENILDGPLNTAAFAQPSGLATDGNFLYVADAEVSGVRAVSLDKRNHRVKTIVGSGLFIFGDVDGTGDEVRLQHCLGVAYNDGKLYIADTYNNKIKVCDPHLDRPAPSGSVETLVGTRQAGDYDNPPQFYEPGGLSVAGSHLYVADTNNHKIRVVDLKEKTVKTVEFAGLAPPAPAPRVPTFATPRTYTLPTAKVAAGKALTLDVKVPLEKGFKLNTDVPMPYLVEAPGKPDLLSRELPPTGGKVAPPSDSFSVEVPLAQRAPTGETFDLKLSVSSFVCNEGSSICLVKSYVWNIPVEVTSDGSTHIKVAGTAK
jgi:DNA-binding beta-propeller fold protein YncE